jgi:hypothetical protein
MLLVFFIFNSFSFYLGLIVGVLSILLIEILFIYYFLGLRNDIPRKPQIIESPEYRPLSSRLDIEDMGEVAEEENKNDVKILYRSICEKNRDEEIEKKLYIDQNYYCNCKFNPENIITIAKMRGEAANRYTQNIVYAY